MGARVSSEARSAAIRRLCRLTDGGTVPPALLAATAVQLGVSARTVRRWMDDSEHYLAPPKSDRFELTKDHLRVLGQEGCLRGAHDALTEAGEVSCSYPTFVRAASRADTGLLGAARDGHRGRIAGRVYATITAPYRNHSWHFDHTKLDLFVLPDHRSKTPVRPWASALVDGATGLVRAVHVYLGHSNTERLTALLADAAAGECYDDVWGGGLGDQVVCDNASEHLSQAITEGCVRLGVLISPTALLALAERQGRAGARRAQLAGVRPLPGTTRGGTAPNGKRRFVPHDRDPYCGTRQS